MFPTKFAEMKGILGDLGVMRIPLKADANHRKKCPYRLNPREKDTAKHELDKMIATSIIEPVDESKIVKFPGKFYMHWLGPYQVKHVTSGGVV